MSTHTDAKVVRLAQARALLTELTPWLSHVSAVSRRDAADLDRLATVLIGDTNVWINAPLALVETEVQAQVRLLARLRDAGLLLTPGEAPDAQ